MNLKQFFAATGGAAKICTTASNIAIIAGIIYFTDCRIAAKDFTTADRCYLSAFPTMGIGVAGRGGYAIGYNTYNPYLRKEDELKNGGGREAKRGNS